MENLQRSINNNSNHTGVDYQISEEMNGKYLTFWTDTQLFGIPISNVIQIVSVQKITAVPDFPFYAKGIINIRGDIIPVIDVRLRLHKQEILYNEKTCIIVTNIQQKLIGFIVDSVDEVVKIEAEDISVPPNISAKSSDAYLTGIAKLKNTVVLLLDSEKMLNHEEVEDD